MASSGVSDADVLALWRRIEVKRRRGRVATARFCVGQHVHNSKQKMKFAKSAEHNFSTEIFRIT